MSAFHPPELRTEKQNKAKKKACQESANMGKVIDMRKNPNSQVNDDDDDECDESCSLQEQ